MSFEFMTLLVYSPRGTSENAQFSRVLAGSCKNGETRFAQNLASKIVELNAGSYFTNAALIPIPRSTPLVPGAVFPSRVLAEILVNNNLGNIVHSCLMRVHPINKSSNNFSAQTRNTVPILFDSLGIDPVLIAEPTLILIDDIFTLGRTAIASAMKLKTVFPDKEIKIFCPFRTRGMEDKNILISLERGLIDLSNDGNGVRLPD